MISLAETVCYARIIETMIYEAAFFWDLSLDYLINETKKLAEISGWKVWCGSGSNKVHTSLSRTQLIDEAGPRRELRTELIILLKCSQQTVVSKQIDISDVDSLIILLKTE